MTDLEADAGRRFEDMDAHEAQEALAEELASDGSATDMTDKDEKPSKKGAKPKNEDEPAPDWSPEERAEHRRMVEALLFAAVEPLTEAAIADRLPRGADVESALADLSEEYESRGVILNKVAGKWRFVTSPDLAHILERERVEPRRLSRAALETLAIIAYHQPCTRADIEDVRGVMVSKGSLDQLLEIGWVRLRGRRQDSPGRPVLYGTTQAFLEHFGLESVADLPGAADLKAAGLLDARLPPGFSVPMPSDAGDDEDAEDEGEDGEFARDFLDGEDAEDA